MPSASRSASGAGSRGKAGSGTGSGSGDSVNQSGRRDRDRDLQKEREKAKGKGKRKADPPDLIDLTGPPPKLRRDASAAANKFTEGVIDLAGPSRKQGARRTRPLDDTFLITAHGLQDDKTAKVPDGYSIVFTTQLGSGAHTLNDSLMLSTEDVNRILVGRYTPFGKRMAVERYDAGDVFPDTLLFDEKGEGWQSGVYKLPLKQNNFQLRPLTYPEIKDEIDPQGTKRAVVDDDIAFTERRWQLSARPAMDLPPTTEHDPRYLEPVRRLSTALRQLPKGKYLVGACRVFMKHVDPATRGAMNIRHGRNLGPGTRSASGSLSNTDITRPLIPQINDTSIGARLMTIHKNLTGYEEEVPLEEYTRHRQRGRKGDRRATTKKKSGGG